MCTNQEKKLSVIVPVYNVREYVEECIESILDQKYSNLEVLLVVNAPTDGSDKICEQYAEKDGRIRLIYIPENHGVYPAWYTGGINATGDYVTFVDADDYVDKDYFLKMVENIYDYDIVCSYHTRITNTSSYNEKTKADIGKYSFDGNDDKNLDDIIRNMQEDDYYIFPAPWAKIYKNELIKSAFNEVGEKPVNGELGWPELPIVYTAFIKCRTIYVTDLYGYYYRMRQGSEGRKSHPNYLCRINSLYHCMKGIFEKDARKEILVDSLQKFCLRRMLDASFRMGFSSNNFIPRYIMPFGDKLKGCKVALYSAHDVAMDYCKQITGHSQCSLAVWVSRNWQQKQKQGLPVEAVDRLLVADYDYIVIAVKREATAKGIAEELKAMGIDGKKILWEKPIHILD